MRDIKDALESARRINIGDVVEVRYSADHTHAGWSGFQFRITGQSQPSWVVKGEVLKNTPAHPDYKIGSEFSWGDPQALVVISLDPDNPTENQVYIDHIYERLTQNATPEELLILAARLEAFATK